MMRLSSIVPDIRIKTQGYAVEWMMVDLKSWGLQEINLSTAERLGNK